MERAHCVGLLQPVTPPRPPEALWDPGDDREGVVLVALLSVEAGVGLDELRKVVITCSPVEELSDL